MTQSATACLFTLGMRPTQNISVLLLSIFVHLGWVERMPPKEIEERAKPRYLFKITMVGPEDRLLEKVLSVINENVVAVDGIRIGATHLETEDSDVRTLFMSPKHSALDILLSLTYKGAKAVMIVLKEPDQEIETMYRNEIRENLGQGIPTRVITVSAEIDSGMRSRKMHSLTCGCAEPIAGSSLAASITFLYPSPVTPDTTAIRVNSQPSIVSLPLLPSIRSV